MPALKDAKGMIWKKSLLNPLECCECGSYGCTIPMPINGRVRGIDYCIADIVAALNAANIKTLASCCGHGKMDADIRLEDGRIIKIVIEEVG